MNKTYKITSIFLALFLSLSLVAPATEAGFMDDIFGFLGFNNRDYEIIDFNGANASFDEDTQIEIDFQDYLHYQESLIVNMVHNSSQNINVSYNISDSYIVTFSTLNQNWNGNETINFTVSNLDGITSSDQLIVIVSPINDAPIANAGEDQIVNEGELVTLDGTNSSDVDGGDILTYFWTAPEGITLSDNTSATPNFTSPDYIQNGTYEFSLVVNDGELDSEEATVTITVNNIFLGGVSVISSTNFGDVTLDEQRNITLTLRSEEEFSQNISLSYLVNEDEEDYMDDGMISFDQESYFLAEEGDEINITLIVEPDSRYQYVADDFEGIIQVKNESGTLIELISINFDAVTDIYEINDLDLNPNTGLEPGDNFDIDVRVENIVGFNLDDVKLKVSVKDIDDRSDISEETNLNNLDEDEKESENFDFDDVGVPYNVDAKKYDLTLKLTGEAEDNDDDYNGKVYFLFREFLEVEKDEDEDVSIINIEMLQTTLNCGGSSTIQFIAVNTGKDDLYDAYMKLTVNELNISENSIPFDLEYNDYDDREKDIIFSITVPENATEGNYTAKIWAYTDEDDLIGYNTVDFNVAGSCTAQDNSGEDQSADDDTNEESDNGNGWEEVTGYTFLSSQVFGSDAFKTVFWILGDLVLIIVAIYFVRKILKG